MDKVYDRKELGTRFLGLTKHGGCIDIKNFDTEKQHIFCHANGAVTFSVEFLEELVCTLYHSKSSLLNRELFH